eukprot:GEMP01042044.1.p1 GENE.GEMP01042044.1~~GEMP01042044.1.p1  ORF type:complete len:506 (+),score=86.87 GEMP01042044.1:156-1673(+)
MADSIDKSGDAVVAPKAVEIHEVSARVDLTDNNASSTDVAVGEDIGVPDSEMLNFEPSDSVSLNSENPDADERDNTASKKTSRKSLWRGAMIDDNTASAGKLTVHSWAVVNSTTPERSRCGSVAFLSISAAVPLVVMMVAYAIFYDAVSASCTNHGECDEGSVCAPSTGRLYPPRLTPGRCLPCSVVTRLHTAREHGGSDHDEEETFSLSGISFLFQRRSAEMMTSVDSVECPYCDKGTTWLHSCLARCEQWTGMTGCLPLVRRRHRVWHYPMFLSFVVLVIWSTSVLEELQDAGMNYKLLEARTRTMELSTFGMAVFLIAGRLIFLSRIVLACTLAHAAWGLLVSDNLSGSNIILNIVGLSYLAQIDDILPLFLKSSARERVNAVLMHERARFTEQNSEWALILIFCAYMVCITICMIGRPEYFAQIVLGGESDEMSCDVIGIVISYYFLLWPTFFFQVVFYYYFIWRHEDASATVKACRASVTCVAFLAFFVLSTNIFYGFIL